MTYRLSFPLIMVASLLACATTKYPEDSGQVEPKVVKQAPTSNMRKEDAELVAQGHIVTPLVPISSPLPKWPRLTDGSVPRNLEIRVGLVIGLDGVVSKVIVYNKENHDPKLIETVIAAVKKWRYEPRRVDGQPVESYTIAILQYQR